MKNQKNFVQLTGFAGKDAQIIEFSGKEMARASMAVNDDYKDALNNEVKKTDWFSLVFWNAKVEMAKEIKTGTNFTVEGKLSTSSYTTKDKEQRTSTEIIVSKITIHD